MKKILIYVPMLINLFTDINSMGKNPKAQEEYDMRENCMPNLPDEIFLNIVEQVIRPCMGDNWNDIFSFDEEFDKEECNRNITNMFLTCRRFKAYENDIINIINKLKAERLYYLKNQIQGQNKLSKKKLDEELLKILKRVYTFSDISKEDLQKMTKFILFGANVNMQNERGNTVLDCAVLCGYKNIVKLLIGAVADIHAQDNNGYSALTLSVMNRRYKADIAKLLISAGADVNAGYKYGYTALMSAAHNGNKNAVELLIALGANIDAQDGCGNTALMYATYNNYRDVVQLLISAGADINIQNDYGYTALIWANGNVIKLFKPDSAQDYRCIIS